MKVTPAERRALEALLEYGQPKVAAYKIGKSARTIEQQLATAKARLGVGSNYEAIRIVIIEGDAKDAA